MLVISGVMNQVRPAAANTKTSEIAVFCTTVSTVIRPWSTWVGVPGVPVPHVEGSE